MIILGTGCGKSGTMWFAELLSSLGHACVHEVQFTPTRSGPLEMSEVSWLAVPFARDYPDAQLVRVVRNPYHVVQSIIRTKFLNVDNEYKQYVKDHAPWIISGRTHLSRAIRYVATWDQRLDELPHTILHPDGGAEHVAMAVGWWLLEGELDVAQVHGLISQLGQVHASPGRRRVPSVAEIRRSPEGHLIRRAAERWGYE